MDKLAKERGAPQTIQYVLEDIECGGGYVKVGPKLSDPKAFGDPTLGCQAWDLELGDGQTQHSCRTTENTLQGRWGFRFPGPCWNRGYISTNT